METEMTRQIAEGVFREVNKLNQSWVVFNFLFLRDPTQENSKRSMPWLHFSGSVMLTIRHALLDSLIVDISKLCADKQSGTATLSALLKGVKSGRELFLNKYKDNEREHLEYYKLHYQNLGLEIDSSAFEVGKIEAKFSKTVALIADAIGRIKNNYEDIYRVRNNRVAHLNYANFTSGNKNEKGTEVNIPDVTYIKIKSAIDDMYAIVDNFHELFVDLPQYSVDCRHVLGDLKQFSKIINYGLFCETLERVNNDATYYIEQKGNDAVVEKARSNVIFDENLIDFVKAEKKNNKWVKGLLESREVDLSNIN